MNNPILLTGTTPYNVMFGREANYNLTPAKEITSSDDLSKHSSDVDESSEFFLMFHFTRYLFYIQSYTIQSCIHTV